METIEIVAIIGGTILTFLFGFWYGYDAGKLGEINRRARALYARHPGARVHGGAQYELWKAAEAELRRLGA